MSAQKFTDPHFKADSTAIYGENENKEKANQGNIEWKRISEIYPDQKLFGEYIEEDDFEHEIETEYSFLTALRVVLRQPESIVRLFALSTK